MGYKDIEKDLFQIILINIFSVEKQLNFLFRPWVSLSESNILKHRSQVHSIDTANDYVQTRAIHFRRVRTKSLHFWRGKSEEAKLLLADQENPSRAEEDVRWRQAPQDR